MCFAYTCKLFLLRVKSRSTWLTPPGKACYNIIRRRKQMLTILSKSACLDRSHFWRLMILANAELCTCMYVVFLLPLVLSTFANIIRLRAVFNLMNGTSGLNLLRWREQERSISAITQIMRTDISNQGLVVYHLQFFTVVACSFVFFLCFATSKFISSFPPQTSHL